jgi:hypothetical protein
MNGNISTGATTLRVVSSRAHQWQDWGQLWTWIVQSGKSDLQPIIAGAREASTSNTLCLSQNALEKPSSGSLGLWY